MGIGGGEKPKKDFWENLSSDINFGKNTKVTAGRRGGSEVAVKRRGG